VKLPWAKVVVGCDGKLNMVHYKVCDNIDGRKTLLVLNFDSFQKHTRMRKCKVAHVECVVGQYFLSIKSQHAKNKHRFSKKGQKFVVDMVCVGGLANENKYKFI
jgi:hypothetical protein